MLYLSSLWRFPKVTFENSVGVSDFPRVRARKLAFSLRLSFALWNLCWISRVGGDLPFFHLYSPASWVRTWTSYPDRGFLYVAPAIYFPVLPSWNSYREKVDLAKQTKLGFPLEIKDAGGRGNDRIYLVSLWDSDLRLSVYLWNAPRITAIFSKSVRESTRSSFCTLHLFAPSKQSFNRPFCSKQTSARGVFAK